MAENIEMSTPIANVSAKPFTRFAPNWLPNQYRMRQVIRVDTLESRMELQARWKPRSIARLSVWPARNSSFIRSKMRMFASTAIPTERMNAAIPESVSVTGQSLKTVSVRAVYTVRARAASRPGSR